MEEKTPICQSCGMPMMKPEDFGTNEDGSKSEDYCTYCFQKGQFTMDGTLEEMTEKLISMHDQMGMTEDEARQMATENLPKLKRWAK